MKRLFKFKYPKIALLIAFIVLSYIIFTNTQISLVISSFGRFSYLSTFIAGFLFALGFTAPLSAGFFIALNPENIFLSALVGGLGAAFANFFVFSVIKFSFEDEFNKLKNSKVVKKLEKEAEKEEELFIHQKVARKLNHYLLYVFAGLLIASPLPDEFGAIMLASLTHIKALPLAIITLFLSSIGIFILLSI